MKSSFRNKNEFIDKFKKKIYSLLLDKSFLEALEMFLKEQDKT